MTRNAEGVIVFAPANAAPLQRVRMSGGTPEPASRLTPPHIGHRFPHFLPDGRHFLFLVSGPPGQQGIYLGSLGSLDARLLITADTAAVFSPPDFVIFGRQDALFAQRLNMRSFEPIGDPMRVADSVWQNRAIFGAAALAASASGTLAYRPAVVTSRRLMWVDRSGKVLGPIGAVETAETDGTVRLSPDGRTIALWIAYQSNAAGSAAVYVRRFPGPGREWRISPAGGQSPRWRADSREIYYTTSSNDLMAVPIKLPAIGDAVDVGAPVSLMQLSPGTTFKPAPDGQRFLLNQVLEDPEIPPITLILNWQKR